MTNFITFIGLVISVILSQTATSKNAKTFKRKQTGVNYGFPERFFCHTFHIFVSEQKYFFSLHLQLQVFPLAAYVSDGWSMHYSVSICTAGSHCIDCGNFTYAFNFQWATLQCPEGTRGDIVRVTAREGYNLAICEIKIFGFG